MNMQALRLGRDDRPDFLKEIRERSGQDASRCLQCGKCTAGCPMSFLYDLTVNQLMRLVVEGRKTEALSSRAVWLCASCHACSARCPAEIEVSAVMEALRHMARDEGYAAERDLKVFADVFLDVLAKYGRVHEIETMLRFNLTSGKLLTGADLGPVALKKGKLHLAAPKTGGRSAVTRIVERFRKERAR